MNRVCHTKPARLFAGLLTILLFAAFPIQPSAQTMSRAHRAPTSYDRAHELTLNGTIQSVISKQSTGRPAGLHMFVATPQGVVYAHLGPYLTKDTREALRSGLPVQIVGAMEKIHGTSYLLVRQLIFSGRMVTVRNERGFLLRSQPSPLARPTAKIAAQVDLTGGAL
jgi:hypothetical protein